MSTKLGVHVADPKRPGLDLILAAHPALVAMVDQNLIADARAAGAVTVFRTKPQDAHHNALDVPQGIDHDTLANMPARAFAWMKMIMPVWKLNQGADFYALTGEWDITNLAAGHLINDFAMEAMRIAEAMGYKLAIGNWSTGNPSDDLSDGKPCSLEDRLDTVLPALSWAASHGHILSIHIHAVDKGDLQTTGEAIALRYRRILRYCEAHGFLPRIAVTELSNGVGGVEPNLNRYLTAIGWWDQTVQAGPYADHVIGGALYGYNAAETIMDAAPGIAQIMRGSLPPGPPPPDPIVKFTGTCPASLYDKVATQVVAAGGTIAKA